MSQLRNESLETHVLCPFPVEKFLNDENLQVVDWKIATDTLIATMKAQRQNFPCGLETPLILIKSTSVHANKGL